jgi:NodT family efflux transporter outer membrane factor (OMF) lipoprotein
VQPLALPEAVSRVNAWAAVPAQAHTQAHTQGPTATDWWRAFNDDTLTELIQQSLRVHTSVRSAQAALRQSRASRDVTQAATLPGLRASASAQRSASGTGSSSQTNDASHVFRAGLDASWELDVFGARRLALQASEADLVAAAAQLGEVRVSLAAEVALTYLEWLTQQQRLQVARQNLIWQQEAEQITIWRQQAGLASQLEVDQTTVVVAQTRAAIAPLEASLQQSRHALAVLLGLPPQAALELPARPSIPQLAGAWALDIPANTLRQRPDVQVAQARLLAAAARRDQATAAQYPGFNLAGSFDWRSPRLSDLFDAGAWTRALVASVSASLFDGGADRARVRAQSAALEQARIALEAALLNALQDVEAALLSVQASQQRLIHLKQAATAAASAENLARQRYSAGLIDTRALLDAQRTRLNAESEQVTALATRSADHVRLFKALGGGWNREVLQRDMKAAAHEDH